MRSAVTLTIAFLLLILQSTVLLLRPSRPLAVGAAVVDGLHAATMVVAALAWPRYRRPALTSAAVATGSAVATLRMISLADR